MRSLHRGRLTINRVTARVTVDGFEATWVDQPPSRFGIEDGFSWAYNLTNNTDEFLDGSQFIGTDAATFTLGPVQASPGETTQVTGAITSTTTLDPLGLATAGVHTVTFGVSGPGGIFTVEMEAVEGSVEEPVEIDPNLVTIEGCGLEPDTIQPGESVTFNAVVQNDNEAPVDAQVTWFVGGWSWSETFQVPQSSSSTVSLPVGFSQTNVDRVGGFGAYDVDSEVTVV